MGCKSFGVNQMFVDLYRVGINGLHDALKKADESGLTDRAEIVELILQSLASSNYIPSSQDESYRMALWREYLRFKGKDFSEFFSAVDLIVRGEPGEELDRFLQMTNAVFADFELRPVIMVEPPAPGERSPQLVVGNEAVVCGAVGRAQFKSAVQKSFSDW